MKKILLIAAALCLVSALISCDILIQSIFPPDASLYPGEGDLIYYTSFEGNLSDLSGSGMVAASPETMTYDGSSAKLGGQSCSGDSRFTLNANNELSDMTLSLWFKISAGNSVELSLDINGFERFLRIDDSKIQMEPPMGWIEYDYFQDSSWHQVVVVVNKNFSQVFLYFDGRQVGSARGSMNAINTFSFGVEANPDPLYIDDLALFDFAMNAEQVKEWYDEQK